MQGWTDNEIFTKLHGDPKLYKRSSVTLPQVKRDDDTREQESPDKENVKPSNIDKLPDIKQSNGTVGSAEHKQSNVQKEVRKEVPKEIVRNVEIVRATNGKKEKRTRSPKKKKFVKRLSNGDRFQKMISSSDDSDNGVPIAIRNREALNGEEKKPTPEAAILRVTGGVELVPLLARRRRVGARTLPSSDVTRPPDQYCQYVSNK